MGVQRLGTRGPVPRSVAERVARKVRVDERGCHVWQGATSVKGYPQMTTGSMVDGTRRPRRVHQVLWNDAHGALPDGMCLHHTCENKLCVNLDHIVLLEHGEHTRLHRHSPTRQPRGPNRTRYAHVCTFCGTDYEANRRDQIYCSPPCRVRAFKAKP